LAFSKNTAKKISSGKYAVPSGPVWGRRWPMASTNGEQYAIYGMRLCCTTSKIRGKISNRAYMGRDVSKSNFTEKTAVRMAVSTAFYYVCT